MRKAGKNSVISVVAPVYNEVEGLKRLVEEIRRGLQGADWPGPREIILVNDGSTDGSGQLLDALARRYPGEIRVIHLSRNFGHGPAVEAGLERASGQVVILMDSDLQDDPAAFKAMVAKWREGFGVVYAQRTTRKESAIARLAFWGFYRLISYISNTRLPLDAGNFALMDRCVVDHLCKLPEQNRYLPGLRAWVGYKQIGIPVPRRERYDNSTRVGYRGLWKLAMNGIFSFSYMPIFLFRAVGLGVILLSAFLICFALYHKCITGKAVAAWASQLSSTAFFSGINLLGIGVIGEYVARIYDEVKRRPRYIVERVTSIRNSSLRGENFSERLERARASDSAKDSELTRHRVPALQ
jgi:dolichol-phosphate mannosyltransferase